MADISSARWSLYVTLSKACNYLRDGKLSEGDLAFAVSLLAEPLSLKTFFFTILRVDCIISCKRLPMRRGTDLRAK